MPVVDLPALKDKLWQSMRADLIQFAPEAANEETLMCCLCGRFLKFEFFDIEHLIPRQALRVDPVEVRQNLGLPANLRSGNLLLCKKPIRYKNSPLYGNGCNSWKGRFYDGPIADLLGGKINPNNNGRAHTNHIIGALMLGYLAMVAEYGLIIALMPSGRLLREQFFRPNRLHPRLGTAYQMVLAGEVFRDPEAAVWAKPFSFSIEASSCLITARNFVVRLPLSRDPTIPIARHVNIVPSRFAFRPNFSTVMT